MGDDLESLLTGRLKAFDRETVRTIRALEAVALQRGDTFAAGQLAECSRVCLASVAALNQLAERLGVR